MKLWSIPVPETPSQTQLPNFKPSLKPRELTNEGSVKAAFILPRLAEIQDGKKDRKPKSPTKILFSSSSFTSPGRVQVLSIPHSDASATSNVEEEVSASSQSILNLLPSSLTSSLDQGQDFYFEGTSSTNKIHGIILRPPNFSHSHKKYPLAFIIHGGPQSAFTYSWSTRWNPNTWTAKGYVTVLINPTGSTGYGQEFVDGIQGQWGGRPFKDLVAGLEYVKKEFEEVDENRMIALGASYGGYMINVRRPYTLPVALGSVSSRLTLRVGF